MSSKRMAAKFIRLLLTILWVMFIYCNSLLNADISSAQSGSVLRVIQKAAEATGISPAIITEYIIRKLAHFCEYALLGFLMTATLRAWHGKIKPHIYTLLFWGLAIPVSDEFLQLFVDGRSGTVRDVVLDFAGFLSAAAIFIELSSLLNILSRRRQKSQAKRGITNQT